MLLHSSQTVGAKDSIESLKTIGKRCGVKT